MKKAIPTEQTPEHIQQVLTLLADSPARLGALAVPLSPKQLTKPLAPGERSITGTLAHLVNTEALNAGSIYLALLKKEPLLHKLHAERDLGKLLRLDRYPFPDLLAYFTFRRKLLLDVLQPLTEKQWTRTVREEGKARRESVYWRARGRHCMSRITSSTWKQKSNSPVRLTLPADNNFTFITKYVILFLSSQNHHRYLSTMDIPGLIWTIPASSLVLYRMLTSPIARWKSCGSRQTGAPTQRSPKNW